jgi:hypothetical protein
MNEKGDLELAYILLFSIVFCVLVAENALKLPILTVMLCREQFQG